MLIVVDTSRGDGGGDTRINNYWSVDSDDDFR